MYVAVGPIVHFGLLKHDEVEISLVVHISLLAMINR